MTDSHTSHSMPDIQARAESRHMSGNARSFSLRRWRSGLRGTLLALAVGTALAPAAAHADPPDPPVPPPGTKELFRVIDTPAPTGVLLQWKIGSPFTPGGTYGTSAFNFQGAVPARIEQLRQSTLNVTNHMCHVRDFCGRLGGTNSYVPFIMFGRAPQSRYAAESGSAKRIYIATGHSPADDIVAHEFGHLMDKTYAAGVRDPSQSRQGDEVEEALADMFAYDYDRSNAILGEDRVGAGGAAQRDWQTPANVMRDHDNNPMTPNLPHPARMLDYACDASNSLPHFNSTILSHGYWLFVQDVGHDVAGDVLHGVSARLPARPRYVDLMRAFKDEALERQGMSARQAAIDAFKYGVGIGTQDPPGC
jgi:hypothetical protein